MSGDVRYTRGDVHLAYRVLGDGPQELVLAGEWASHLETQCEEPSYTRTLERLASFSRLLVFDKRGVGLSDPVVLDALPSIESWMDDLRLVIDAAHFTRPAILGTGAGSALAILFAATHPDRVSALALFGGYARLSVGADHPEGVPRELLELAVPFTEEHWGTGATLDQLAPGAAADARFRAWYARFQRQAMSPGAAVAMQRLMLDVDVRAAVPSVRAPTLVLHRAGDRIVPLRLARWLADHLPSAELVVLPGADHLFYCGDTASWIEELREFLTGERHGADPDRVLATLLFTDLVSSTELAHRLGDERWRQMLDQHDVEVRRQLVRFGGRAVKFSGDGILAVFDAPARAIRCGAAIRDAVAPLGLEVRAGVHTGEVERRGDDIGGVAVHLGARVAAQASSGEVLVSRTVVDLVAGSGLAFVERGEHELKGLPGRWPLYAALV